MRILLAMSGGIDSSVIAYLLKEQGHDLVGVRFLLWMDPKAPAEAQILSNKCCDAQSAARAKRIAKDLGFPLHTINLSEKFKREVVDYYIDECRKNVTPNPCVRCNKIIRFEALLELMDDFGCEKLATGHYARIKKKKDPAGSDYFALLQGKDELKDQSYFLYRLTQKHLSRIIFPLGKMRKKEVYSLAKKYSVPLDAQRYRESQDLCFFPEKEPNEFIKRYLGRSIKHGDMVKPDGIKIGEHRGLPFYTIGQRRIGVGGFSKPQEVIGKDVKNNLLIVGEKGSAKVNKIFVRDLSWTAAKPMENSRIKLKCRTRSLSPFKTGFFKYSGQKGVFSTESPIPPSASGQSLVLYNGNEVIGGGVIFECK